MARNGGQGSHWSWEVLKLDMGAEKIMKKSWFLLVLFWKTKILNPLFFSSDMSDIVKM